MAVRSGRKASSIGVGTVTMWKSASHSRFVSVVNTSEASRRSPGIDFAGTVVPFAQFGDAARIDVESNDTRSRSRKADRHGQADIAEPNDGDLPVVTHVGSCNFSKHTGSPYQRQRRAVSSAQLR